METDAWWVFGDFKQEEAPLARAIRKARTQGARLILARALEDQAMLFSALGRTQDAIALCRESREISASAGDRQSEARALRATADVLSNSGDLPGSIHLYQQALTISQRTGSEGGVASVLNNLADVYQAEGDLATAEKMYRQAQASYRLLDDETRGAMVTGNIADVRREQGDLPGAIQLYEEQVQLGDASNTLNAAFAGNGIAYVHQLQGDLAGAKQGLEHSLATWQKNGDQDFSAYAMWSLGSLLLQEADFSGSRKMYDQALAWRTLAGEKLTIAETQLSLADLSLEEGHIPADQEATVRKAVEAFQQQRAHDDETLAWGTLARTLLGQGKAANAKQAMQHARSLAAKSQNPNIRWQTATTAARIETAEKDFARSAAGTAARKELSTIITKSRELGYMGIELDARLALAEIEMKAGQTAAGRAHLATIEADAKTKGYNLIARKAATARG
jgi:tetratricopeptide (TPR) repeat protein